MTRSPHPGAERDLAGLQRVARPEDIEHAARLVGRHRRIGHQQRLVGRLATSRTRAKMPGLKMSCGLSKRARTRMVPMPVSASLSTKTTWPLREPGLVRKGKLHRIRDFAREGPVPRCGQADVSQRRGLVDVEAKSMGSMVTMVASNVAVLASPPETRLPGLTRCRPMRPVSGPGSG